MSRGIFSQISDAGTAALDALKAQIVQLTTATTTAQSTATAAGTAATAAASPAAVVHADLYAKLAALQAALAAIIPGITTIALAQGSTVAVLLNGTGTVTLQLSHQMPDTTYTVEPPRLTGATFTEASRTRTSITFTVTASVAITAGQPLVGAAWR